MKYRNTLFLLATSQVAAFSWVPDVPGVESPDFSPRSTAQTGALHRDKKCPFNPNHPGAVPINKKYPYLGAIHGRPGTGKGGIRVPAPGDTAHHFEAPGSDDIRGPCPGLNTAANHHFISHDGITTLTELIDMQQNLYNVGYNLAVGLAVLGLAFDGDLISEKLSIGCDATGRTSHIGSLLGRESGLNGHNKFEADTSLTRNDYFLADGDDYSVNATLFGMMAKTCKNNFEINGLAKYRYQRYRQGIRDNPHFYFGPGSSLLYGAASFLYELFPGDEGKPDLATEMSFFGIGQKQDGSFYFNNQERIPENWSNRKNPYTLLAIADQIETMSKKYKAPLGGNAGKDNFIALNVGKSIVNGHFTNSSGANMLCFFYQLVEQNVPAEISKVYTIPQAFIDIAAAKLAPAYEHFGCGKGFN